MNKLRQQAETLRTQGYSYNMIHERLGISKGTMSYWFRDKPFKPNAEVIKRMNNPHLAGLRRHEEKVQEIVRLKEVGISEIGKLSKRDLWLLGLGLYIGEGAKTVEAVRLANSDPAVIASFIEWLVEICGLKRENIAIRLHLYPDSNVQASIKYWQKVTGLDRSRFRKEVIDTRIKKSSSIGKLPHGTAHLLVTANGDPEKGVRLFRRIQGWKAGVLKQL